MSADPKVLLTDLLQTALKSVAPELAATPILLERPKQASHGDFATNLALQLAKPLKRNPRELAGLLLAELPPSKLVARAEVAGAGFINFTLASDAKTAVVREVLAKGADFGRGAGKGIKVQVEFVSANPTGPLHVGHGRGAAYGASLSDVLAFAGYEVSREYYVNDAGRQMDILALSTWLRYLAFFGIEIPFPPNAYQGDYVVDMGREMRDAHQDRFAKVTAMQILAGTPGLPPSDRKDDEAKQQREEHLDALIANAKKLLGEDYPWVHGFALNEQLGDGREDLQEFGVRFDKWFSEQSLFDTGLVERAVIQLEKAGHIYLQDGAKWFRSTAFGDEKDRVVQRENGLFTYFASDIAYHLNKYERGFDRMIDIWGADHHGYIPRVKGAIAALGLDPARLDVAWCSSRCSTATARRPRCPPARASSSPCASCAARWATMPAASSTCCASPTSTSTSTSTSPRARATRIRCITSSTPTPACARCSTSGAARPRSWPVPTSACCRTSASSRCARVWRASPSWCRTPPPATRRTRSRSTSRISLPTSIAGTTPSACWSRTRRSSSPASRSPRRCARCWSPA